MDKRELFESMLFLTLEVDSSAILRSPPRISLAKIVVGIASSRRRSGVVDLGFVWIQKLTFPRRWPNIVPVIVVEGLRVGIWGI